MICLYLIGGFAYTIGYKKAAGRERIPNSGFWCQLPGFVVVCMVQSKIFLTALTLWILHNLFSVFLNNQRSIHIYMYLVEIKNSYTKSYKQDTN